MKAGARLLCLCWLVSMKSIAAASPPSRDTINAALLAIRDRALVVWPLPAIALEGVKGLASLDPTLAFSTTAEHRLEVGYGGHMSTSYAMPPDDDVAGWSRLIDQVTREAARHSRAIASADQDLTTEAVIDGFLSKLDIFSHYAGPREAHERQLPESPAAAAGLRVGDRITAIDGEKLDSHDLPLVAMKLRGPEGSVIRLSVLESPSGTLSQKSLRRGLVVPPTVTLSIDHGIGLIAVASFNQNTGKEVADAVRKAKAAIGFKGILLDLRGNQGGLLDQAVMVADQFIDHGRILATRGRHPDAVQSQDARPGDAGEGVALVVLIDGRTASAAEILAADLQDIGHGVLVGTNSFGKGAIQTVVALPNGGEMTLTWSRFVAPSGYALHGLGVLPAICTAGEGKATDDLKLAGGRAAPPVLFAAWRGVAADDMQQRFKLRAHCLAADHGGDQADVAIARHLLTDRTLFARALAVSEALSTPALGRGGTAFEQR